MDRRRFLQGLAVAAATPAIPLSGCANVSTLRQLRPDRHAVLDLPEGFSYGIVSRAGDRMSDDLLVPHAHDGMAAFAGKQGRVILVCNHELGPAYLGYSAFGASFDEVPKKIRNRVYDLGAGTSPGAGGTTTTIYNPATGITERQFLSLAGTETNCAGGATPWGSWLSCEECFESPGPGRNAGHDAIRERSHGYVFEVPAHAEGLVEPVPINGMGRFEHEAAAVHEGTGIVYLTEDRHRSLFYRYIPNVPGKLHDGGRLQALTVEDRPAFATHNWSPAANMPTGVSLRTDWIDLDNVDSVENDLRLRGTARGAATFARGEGLCAAGDEFFFSATIGGAKRLGQVFSYRTSPEEGNSAEQDAPGELTLIAEADDDSLLRNADTMTMAPWGDLLVCEDTANHCGIVGVASDGNQYALADNPYSGSELAGVCFSPDGNTMFVNIQYPGMTLAITGPWPT